MLSRLLGQPQPTPDFPSRADLPHLAEKEAYAALGLLRLLVDSGAAECYTAAGSTHRPRPLWNVWLVKSFRRIELERWAFMVLCLGPDPDGADGGEAA
jgi:hypothetical protein